MNVLFSVFVCLVPVYPQSTHTAGTQVFMLPDQTSFLDCVGVYRTCLNDIVLTLLFVFCPLKSALLMFLISKKIYMFTFSVYH